MPAYLIVRIAAAQPELLKPYQLATPAVVAKYHGRFIVRGGPVVSLEGPGEHRRIVVLEFPDLTLAQAFYHSPEYAAAKQLRAGIAEAEIIAVEGFIAPAT
ncbi:MAG: hypothetical protein RLZZ385_1859 [Pseudomonadota bacterium]|jgi:uncharacterized protein (DUF1330 family)